jgi:cell division protein ZapA
MPTVEVMIGSRSYELMCGDGQESRLRSLAQMVDEKYAAMAKNIDNSNDRLILVLTALTIQDELLELKAAAPSAATNSASEENAVADTINVIAKYIEDLTEKVEAKIKKVANTS